MNLDLCNLKAVNRYTSSFQKPFFFVLFDYVLYFRLLKEKLDKKEFSITTHENNILQLNKEYFDLKEFVDELFILLYIVYLLFMFI